MTPRRVEKRHRQTPSSVLSRIIFFLPLSILVVERIVGIYLYSKPSATGSVTGSLTSIAPVLPITASLRILSLPELTQYRADQKCPLNLTLIADVVYSKSSTSFTSTAPTKNLRRSIPRIIHQTSRSRCMTEKFAQTMQSWQHFDGWSYYLHDDSAIRRLFQQEYVHFPLLKDVAENCLLHGTLLADLWRYLVLWRYGGIYVDLDAIPNKFHPETSIAPHDEAYFVVEQYHMLSQYFMAVSPQHPLMWYAIHDALLNLYQAMDTGAVRAAFATGPNALHHAYMNFRRDAGDIIDPAGTGYKPVWKGTFRGTSNWTVTVAGVGEDQNEYINRDVIGARFKLKGYKRMEMSHFQKDEKDQSGISCIRSIMRLNGPPPRAPR